MSSKQQFLKIAEKAGLDVDYEIEAGIMQVWSPVGKILDSSGCHVDAGFGECFDEIGRAPDWKKASGTLKSIIDLGMSDCPLGDACDICNPCEQEA